MADETDQFLRSLYQHAKQDGEDPEEVAKRIYQNNRGVSRRELLAGGGALGLGAAMGGGGAMAATGQASADASTSDSDGNVGTPSDLVDVFGDGSEFESINGRIEITSDDDIVSKVNNATSPTEFVLERGATWNISTVLDPPAVCRFVGPRSATIRMANGADLDALIKSADSDLELIGFTLDPNDGNQTSSPNAVAELAGSPTRTSYFVVRNMRVENVAGIAFSQDNVDLFEVSDCEIYGAPGGAAIRCQNDDGTAENTVAIERNHIEDFNSDTINIDANASVPESFPGARICGNTMRRAGLNTDASQPLYLYAIFIGNAPYSVIEGNIVENEGNPGCFIDAGRDDMTGARIANNVGRGFAGDSDVLFNVDSAPDADVSHNHVETSADARAFIIADDNPGMTFADNTARGPGNGTGTAFLLQESDARYSGLRALDFGTEFDVSLTANNIGFSPTDVSGSRTAGTTYTNDAETTRRVRVTVDNGGSGINARLFASNSFDSYKNSNSPTNHRTTFTVDVSPGDDYILNDFSATSVTIQAWEEWFLGRS